jgi:hypothetical protein
MKQIKAIVKGCIIAMSLMSCDKLTSKPQSDCEKNHTAKVKFRNNSTSNKTYNIVWDGLSSLHYTRLLKVIILQSLKALIH